MPVYVRFPAEEKQKIMDAALSREVIARVKNQTTISVTYAAVECLLDYLLQMHDLWYDDALALHPAGAGAFFAIKIAFQVLQRVTLSTPDVTLEEEHIIDAFNKRGYSPWY